MEGICCVECFKEPNLRKYVEDHGEELEEPCHYCDNKKGNGIDISALEALFAPVVREHYTPYDSLPNFRHVDPMTGESLEDLLDMDFDVFSEEVSDREDLLFGILNSRRDYKDPVEFDSGSMWFGRDHDWTHVSLEELRDDSLSKLTEAIKKHGHTIVNFAERGKLTPEVLDAYNDILSELTHSSFTVRTAEPLWRARIGDWADMNDVRPPPAHKATPGRCNFGGQPVLYAASTLETAVSEVRPGKHSSVAVAEFRLTKDGKVCDLLAKPRPVSPFTDFKAYQREQRRRALAGTLGRMLAAPVRPGDEPAEYLVTQVLCRMIFSKGFDGIRYHSSQDDGGVNFVFLDPEAAQPRAGSLKNVTVKKVTYELS